MTKKPRLVGINHVALEVGSVEEALDFYSKIFDFQLRGRGNGMAFIDIGDQFIALTEGRTQKPDGDRHFGLVVDNKGEVRRKLEELGAHILPMGRLDFLDPWGNHIQIVEYSEIQFTKAQHVLKGMGMAELQKGDRALKELAAKGLLVQE